jgi:hypothetical protein
LVQPLGRFFFQKYKNFARRIQNLVNLDSIDIDHNYQFNRDTDSISHWDTVVHDSLNPIINTNLIIAGFVIVVEIIKFKWFIKLRVISHYGILKGCSPKYENSDHLIITIIQNTTHWLNGYIREIVIKYPLSCLDASANIGYVSIIGEFLFPQYHRSDFRLIYNLGENYSSREYYYFRLSSINWMEGGKPTGFDKANVHGVCYLDFISTCYGYVRGLE